MLGRDGEVTADNWDSRGLLGSLVFDEVVKTESQS